MPAGNYLDHPPIGFFKMVSGVKFLYELLEAGITARLLPIVRAIFVMQKLYEVWDKLNLFEIVRCYKAHDMGRANIGTSTPFPFVAA